MFSFLSGHFPGRRLRDVGMTASIAASMFMTLSGCTVTQRSAYMDSTSRMPWFSLELKRSKPKDPEPNFRAVRSDNRSENQVAPLGLFRGGSAPVASSDATGSAKSSRKSLPITEQLAIDSKGDTDFSSLDFH